LATLIQIRRDSEANWVSNNPVLALGELAYSTDISKLKVGNGSSNWSSLAYINVLPSEIAGLNTDEISEGTTNLYFTNQRAIDAVAGGDFNTDVVEEGTVNLYYTDTRVENVIANSDTDDLTEGTVNLYFTNQRAIDAVADGDFSTDVVEEGTVNLYYTDARVEDVLAASDTDSLSEGTTNLYYTDTRVENVISASDTDDISEGTQNLYFTESRSRSSISGSTGIIYSSTDGVIHVDTEEISTVAYVNATAEGLHVHTSVAVATVANIADLASPPATIDGVTLTEGMRVLVKDQTDLSENGIYVVDTGALVRADDHDTSTEVRSGDFVFVTGGDTQASTGFVQVNDVTTLDTDPIEWTQFIGAGTFTAGTGLDLNGNVFSLDADTDLVSEGTSNLYFTDQRAIDAVVNGSVDTDDIEEGTVNLYYTDTRVENVIASSDTDDLAEGTTNLYFTAQRAVDAVTQGDVDTDDISEGTSNLYFTNQRAIDAVVENISVDDLSDVSSESPSDGDVLIYSTTTQSWTPGEIAVIDGGTP
jgi:nucleoside diphosphate kinase